MMYQLLNEMSYYVMVTEKDRDRKFSYTSIYSLLFIGNMKYQTT